MPIKNTFAKFKSWYKARPTRPVTVWLGLSAFVLAVASSLDPTGYVFYGAMALLGGAVGASIVDTWQSMQIFNATITEAEQKHAARQIELFGSVLEPSCFTEQDRRDIRQKKIQFRLWLAFKAILIIILIAFLVGISI